MQLPPWCAGLALAALLAACSDGPDPAADALARERAVAAVERQRWDDARTALAPLAAREPAELQDLVDAAGVEIAASQPARAAELLARAAALAPDSAAVHYMRGTVAYYAGELEQARPELARALELAPENPSALYALGICADDLDEDEEAVRLFERLVAVGPENAGLWYAGAVYRLSRIFALDGPEAEARRFGDLWGALEARKVTPPNIFDVGLGRFGTLRARRPQGTSAPAPAPLSEYRAGPPILPELAAASELFATDLDGDVARDLLACGPGGLAVALRAGGSWTATRLVETPVAFARAFDVDNDGDLDVLHAGAGGLAILVQDQDAQAWRPWPGVLPELPSAPADVVAVDFDHEGDLDLLLAGPFGARLWRYDGAEDPAQAKFVDVSAEASLPDGAAFAWCATEDFDGDNDVDLLLGGPAGTHLADSLRAGRFEDVGAKRLGSARFALEPWLADFDGDARPDLWAAEGLWRQQPDGSFRAPAAAGAGARPIAAADLDLDGTLDVAWIAADGTIAGRLSAGFATEAPFAIRPGFALAATAPLAAGDLDGDGIPDLAVSTPEGVRILARAKNANRGVRVSWRGLNDNRRAVGAIVEARSGMTYRRIYGRGEPEIVGVGEAEELDVLRITWPNGTVTTEVGLDLSAKAGTDNPEGVLGGLQASNQFGSCPFLYTWNGERMVFVSDVLGITPLGLPMAPGLMVPPDHDEYVLVRGSELAPRGGVYELALTEELREVTYLDQARLLVVDHPSGTEVFPNERFTFPPFPEPHVHTVRDALSPRRATGSDGRDWTRALAAIDDEHAAPFVRAAPQYTGMAEPWFLDLEFDPARVAAAPKLRLFLTGWLYWSNASANLAAARSADVRFVPPIVQVPDGQGGWVDAGPPIGFPAGKPKTMVVDVGGMLRRDDPRMRLFTTLQLHWDAIRLAVDADDAPKVVTEVPLLTAELALRGFSAPLERGLDARHSTRPERFDWSVLEPQARWDQHPGLYTRLGECAELARAIDDRFVILGSGDALTLRFDATRAPELRDGWTRDYLLFLDGWAKDRDANTLEALYVEPLPFHGMSGYPYGPGEHYPDDEAHEAYRRTWNTRPALRWIRPLAPAREAEWLLGG